MRAGRQKHISKPVLLHEIVYQHREEAQSSSEASFLRLSDNSSTPHGEDSELFQSMQLGIAALQQKSLSELNQVQASIHAIQHHKKQPKISFVGAEEGKENLFSGVRGVVHCESGDEQQACTFELDEHRNYVQCSPPLASKGSKTISIEQHNTRELPQSPENSKAEPETNRVSTKRRKSCSLYSERVVDALRRDTASGGNTKRSSSTVTRRRSESGVSSAVGSERRGRVYESILSLYSTRRLIAMEGRK